MPINFFRLICIFALLLGHGLSAKVIYVDDNASAGGDGFSWSTAHKYLQDALAVALSGDEIWVAEGVYKPDQGAGKTAGDRTASFNLVSGVGMYGGFLGTETTRIPQGDSNQTILSGEISEDSELWSINVLSGTNLGHSKTVMFDGERTTINDDDYRYNDAEMIQVDLTTNLEGFIITKGNANRDGGGLYLEDSNLTITNCVFTNNSANESGGGISFFHGSFLTLNNCEFSNNIANIGAGVYFGGEQSVSSLIILDCTFHNNSATSDGGAVYSLVDNLSIKNSVFEGNKAHTGGGIYNATFSNTGTDTDRFLTILSCIFSNNEVSDGQYEATSNGGAIYINASQLKSNISNSVFCNNVGGGNAGGAITFALGGSNFAERPASHLNFTNSVFTHNYNNFPDGGIGGIIDVGEGSLTVVSFVNCISWENYTFDGDFYAPEGSVLEWHAIFGLDLKQASGKSNIFQGTFADRASSISARSPSHVLTILDDSSLGVDPLFVNIDNPIGPDGIWFTEDDGLRLLEGSPAIDAGTEINSSIEYDVAGSVRRFGGAIDIGAYEYIEGTSSSNSSSSGDGANNQSEGNGSNDSQNSSNEGIASSVVYSLDGSRWVELDWFGYFFDSNNVVSSMKGWVFHEDLGWLYTVFSSNEKAWVWTQKNGWLWTSNSVFPYLYSNESTNWIYVISDTQTDVKVFDYRPNQWTTWQDLTLLRMADSDPTVSQSNSTKVKEIKSVVDSSETNEKKITAIAEIIRSNL